MPPLFREGDFDSPNKALHKLIFISKYRDNSILRDEVVANSICGNTDSQHLLAKLELALADLRTQIKRPNSLVLLGYQLAPRTSSPRLRKQAIP